MNLRAVVIAAIALGIAGCGVKTNLERPSSEVLQQPERKDPSKPPTPLGEPGGTTPPYTTGP